MERFEGAEIDLAVERKHSRKRMEDSYNEMMDTYTKQQKALASRPSWSNIKTAHSEPPGDLTITHINQTKDLMRTSGIETTFAESQSSGEWLKNHSIETLKLTLKDLVDKGKIGKPATNKETGKVQQHIQFEATDINEFEYKLNLAIETYTKRIKWLLQGSKRIFGLMKGSRVAVLIDTSDANCGFGRLTSFQDALTHLLDEQLSQKHSLYMVSFGTEPTSLWSNPRDVNCRIIDEAKQWVANLQPAGGCNLLKALKQVHKMKDINSICIILGSVPDQSSDILCDYVKQLGIGRNIIINTVAYDCSNHLTNITLRKLAEESGGRYHCYTATCEEQIYTGTDISLLLKEIQKSQDIINKIKDMRQGLLGTALVSVMNEISTEVAKLPQSRFLPRPPGHEAPLRIEMPKFHAASSAKWLSQHGLKAKGLDLYQVLAPNAYSFKEGFIPVIRKTVQSQVHEKAMAQFQWKDGSMKNIHVDMTQLFEYQKQLGAIVKLYEKRIDWLSSASRRIFGTVAEKNVVILLDLSVSNINYLVHIQHSIRLILEQQLANKDYFNIIGLCGEPKRWKPTMVKPTPENLQEAWRWVLDLQCEGSRNFLSGLKVAMENEEERKHNIEAEGIYVFTSGIPDQSQDVCCSYIEEASAGKDLKIHVILFNVDDYDQDGPIPGRYANITKTSDCLRNIAHCSGGRFHWFRETGIIESDDIAAITHEIEKGLNFSKKSAMLVDSVKKKYNIDYEYLNNMKMLPPSRTSLALTSSGLNSPKALPPPKHTTLSHARLQMNGNRDQDDKPRALTWRPSSATSRGSSDDGSVRRSRPQSAHDPMQRVKGKRVQRSYFFTEEKVQGTPVGAVFQKYPHSKSVRKAIKMALIPDKEEQITAKDWLRQYSLSHLKLDLNKLVSGPECKVGTKPVPVLNKVVEGRTFNIFPTINVQGTLKYLQLLPHELSEYEEVTTKVLRRYLKRLQWLLSGSRRVFGTVVEKKCAILVDTSGSMDPHMDEVRKELASLIWEQLYKHKVSFNLIQFSKKCESWQPRLVRPTEENCHDAVKWVSHLYANGNTCTLDALEMAFKDPEVEAIYLLTDGKPDTSTSLVLREVANMNTDRNVVIHTISFNCEDSTANNFLKMLAAETAGRFHRCHSDFDAELFAHKLLTEGFEDYEHPALPEFEGDDLRRIGHEIAAARRFLSQSQSYRAMYPSQKPGDPPSARGAAPGKSPVVGRPTRPMSAKC